MKMNIIKNIGLVLSVLILISGALVLTGCEDTLMPLIEEQVRLAENKIVFLTLSNTGVGTTVPEGTVEVASSTPFPISAIAGIDNMFYRWTTNDSGVVFDNIYSENTNVALSSGDATISADFVDSNLLHTLIINTSNASWGSTNPSGSINAINNNLYSISTTPVSSYHFVNWAVSSGPATITDVNSSSTDVKVVNATPAGAIIQANFALNTYSLDVQQDSEGAGNESGDGGYNDGAPIPIYAGDPVAGNIFTHWSVESGSGSISINDENSPTTNVTIIDGTHADTIILKANFSRILYIAGYEENSSGIKIACYWEYNTETGIIKKTVLGNGTDTSEATSISLFGAVVYIGGWEGSNGYYWTHTNYGAGTLTKNAITGYDNGYNGKVHSIYVNPDEDIYLAGEHYSTPTSWNPNLSGQAYLQGGYGAAFDLFFNEGSDDYFVAGTITATNPDKAVLWVNPDGTSPDSISLTSGSVDAAATSIFEYGTTLYIGGWEGANGYYWTYTNEGTGTLTQNAIAGYNNGYNGKVHSIYVNAEEYVFLVGEHYSEPTNWNPTISGQAYLEGGNGAALDLFYCEDGSGDYYITGYIDSTKDKAVLWVNPNTPTTTSPVNLTNGTTNNARANAIISY